MNSQQLVVAEPESRSPVSVAGDRFCPPENCGGTYGYQELIGTLADPTHPEHEHMLAWLGIENGRDFDPARFDLNDANRRLDATVRGAFGGEEVR